jgi:hypothetical protein
MGALLCRKAEGRYRRERHPHADRGPQMKRYSWAKIRQAVKKFRQAVKKAARWPELSPMTISFSPNGDMAVHEVSQGGQDYFAEMIRESVDWARDVLSKNGIDPDSMDHDSLLEKEHLEFVSLLSEFEKKKLNVTDELEALKQREQLNKDSDVWVALVAFQSAQELNDGLKFLDLELAFRVVFLSIVLEHARERDEQRFHLPFLYAGLKIFSGGAKGRQARKAKITVEQKADIRHKMAAAKHGTKKATKEDLAKKHRISVRQIERIAVEK